MNPIKIEIDIPYDEIKNFVLDVISNSKEATYSKKPTELFTVLEVSKMLRVNPNTVYNLIRNKHITALRLGSLKITSKELERFLNYANGKDFTDLNNIKELKLNKE